MLPGQMVDQEVLSVVLFWTFVAAIRPKFHVSNHVVLVVAYGLESSRALITLVWHLVGVDTVVVLKN